jgi:hypothetical protein
MKVMGWHLVFPTVDTESKILFPILGHYSVHNAVITETVQDPIDGCTVYINVDFPLNGILAHGLASSGQQIQYRFFGRCASSFHNLLMRLCCNNKNSF